MPLTPPAAGFLIQKGVMSHRAVFTQTQEDSGSKQPPCVCMMYVLLKRI